MGVIALFHSVLGLRAVEERAAERLRAAGHTVLIPDLYAGQVAKTIEDGFVLMDQISWAAIEERARLAVRSLPHDAVLAGISMGAGVVDSLLPSRPHAAGILLLHGIAQLPATTRPGLPVQLHIADPDPFAGPSAVADWRASALDAGAAVQVYSYPDVGHFYLDADLPDYDAETAELTWQRALTFLRSL